MIVWPNRGVVRTPADFNGGKLFNNTIVSKLSVQDAYGVVGMPLLNKPMLGMLQILTMLYFHCGLLKNIYVEFANK